eukprot:3384021-Rhodomonas_salina.1
MAHVPIQKLAKMSHLVDSLPCHLHFPKALRVQCALCNEAKVKRQPFPYASDKIHFCVHREEQSLCHHDIAQGQCSMNNGPISWKSKCQSCVTLSSAEAEFVAASLCGQEVIYLRNLLRDLDLTQDSPTDIWEDNAS